jgi:hypothetical protein
MSVKPKITEDQYNSLLALYENTQKQIQAMTSDFEKEKLKFEEEKNQFKTFLESKQGNLALIDLSEMTKAISNAKLNIYDVRILKLDEGLNAVYWGLSNLRDVAIEGLTEIIVERKFGREFKTLKLVLPNSLKEIISKLETKVSSDLIKLKKTVNEAEKRNKGILADLKEAYKEKQEVKTELLKEETTSSNGSIKGFLFVGVIIIMYIALFTIF